MRSKISEKFERAAKFFMSRTKLVIAGNEYSIESVNIHDGTGALYTGRRSDRYRWYIQFKDRDSNRYTSFIDYDISENSKNCCGLRINAIKDNKGNVIGPVNNVFKYIKNRVGTVELEKYHKCKVGKLTTPELYIKSLDRHDWGSIKDIFQVPRFLSDKPYKDTVEIIEDLVEPLMFTKSFKWMKPSYNQKILITFYFLKYLDKSKYPTESLLNKKSLRKYIPYFDEGKSMNRMEINIKYKQTKKHKIFFARIAGYYYK